MYDCSKHIISQDASLIEAIERINGLSGQSMVLFAVDCQTLARRDSPRDNAPQLPTLRTRQNKRGEGARGAPTGNHARAVPRQRMPHRGGLRLHFLPLHPAARRHNDGWRSRREAATADTDHPEAAAQNRRQVHHRLQRGGSCQERGEKHCRHDQLPRRAAR